MTISWIDLVLAGIFLAGIGALIVAALWDWCTGLVDWVLTRREQRRRGDFLLILIFLTAAIAGGDIEEDANFFAVVLVVLGIILALLVLRWIINYFPFRRRYVVPLRDYYNYPE